MEKFLMIGIYNQHLPETAFVFLIAITGYLTITKIIITIHEKTKKGGLVKNKKVT